MRGEKLNLEYEGLHSICFKCGVYGHRMDVCPQLVVPSGSPGSVRKKAAVQSKGKGEQHGGPVKNSVGVEGTSTGCDVVGDFGKDIQH